MGPLEATRIATRSGWLQHEEKTVGLARFRRKWFMLCRTPKQFESMLLCFSSDDADRPDGIARLKTGSCVLQHHSRRYPCHMDRRWWVGECACTGCLPEEAIYTWLQVLRCAAQTTAPWIPVLLPHQR
jgi:hypothetical protein